MRINISQIIDQSPMGGFQIRVVVLCALVALLDGLDIQMMALVIPKLASEWALPAYSFGPVLSASLAGIMLGAMSFGILGDRFGRRAVLIGAFVLVGAMSILTSLAHTPVELIAYRFFTGLGIGGCLPNATALTAEYVASRRQAFVVTVMFSAVPLGGLLGGYFAGDLINWLGWRALFILGGTLPLIISLFLYFGLPESIRFLVRHGGANEQVGRILERIDRGYRYDPGNSFVTDDPSATGASLALLFAEGRAVSTMALWIVFFFSLFGMYMLTSWLPSVFSQQGWPMNRATQTVSFFWLGGIIGGWVVGWMIDRVGPYRALGTVFVAAGLLVAAIGVVGNSIERVMITLVFVGFAVAGAQTGTTAFAAGFYPTAIRSTGVGWGLGVGRLGAVISPLLGGVALASHWPRTSLFAAAAVPPLICAATIFTLRVIRGSSS